MVTNNKVLTVSYGTFSCTLEGFEDSFDTMKVIAEYFRDLAADDRYFGAEPPTPDADMLARIAEREIERRVSARMDQGAIVLSAADRVAPEQEAAEVFDDDTQAEPVIEEPAEDLPVEEMIEEADHEAPEEDTVDNDVAKAGALAAAAAAAAAVISADDDAEAHEEIAVSAEEPVAETSEDVVEASLESPAPDTLVETQFEDTPAEPEDITLETVAEAVAEEVADAPETADEAIEDSAIAVDADDILDSLAEELADESTTEEAEASAMDDTIDALAASDVLILQDSIQAALADDVPAAVEPVEEVVEAIEAADVEILDPVAEDANDEADDWNDDEESSDYETDSIAAKLERIRAVVSRGNSEADTDGFSEDEHARDLTSADDAQEEALTQDIFAADAEIDDISDAAEPKPALRARVVRMKKADFEEAVASGLLEAEEVNDDVEDAYNSEEDILASDDVASPAEDTSLTPEDEADLMAELAKVEAELKGDIAAEDDAPAPEEADSILEDDYATAPEELFTEEDAVAVADATFEEETPKSGDDAHGKPDLSRLMAKADSEMEEPEGSRRRRAIAHLRAAVAATRAEKAAGMSTANQDDTVAYRDDLASVVRAVPGGKADEPKPAKAKNRKAAAPLKLVAEQRVDPEPEEEAAPVAAEETKTQRRVPVRPRRVSTDRKDRDEIARTVAPVGSVASVQGGFADYAQSVGATSMAQILEAAAAYVTFVKGQERFSRPMLMRMARDANEAEFSREEGLRSFGQLLRDQKIRKIAGGRFTADESINFKPADRAAG